MSLAIPTFQDLLDTAVSNYETALGQDAPVTPKAFLRVLAYVQALTTLGLYKLAAERQLQTLALTATGEDLQKLGDEYGVEWQDAIAAELDITITGDPGLVLAGTVFVGDSNGLEYYTQTNTVLVGSPGSASGSATVTCYTAGVDGNLVATDTMTLSAPLSGVDDIATVTAVSVAGVDQEGEEVFRRQVLDQIQTTGGGSNSADFRNWGQEVTNINRVFPYSGTPVRMSVEFPDWDMEKTGYADWLTGNNPVLTKQTSDPHSGTRCLRIQRGADPYPSAYQNVLKYYNTYRIRGYARSDGTCVPDVRCGNHTLWIGNTSTDWQEIDVTINVKETSTDTFALRLLCGGGASGNYVEFDDFDIIQTEFPGHVTVYVECDASVDADGIPTSALLSDVRDYITTDPITNIDRPSLGLVDDNLFVEPIIRTAIYIEIRGLDVASEYETQLKSDLDADLDSYLRNATPYIQGLDPASSQADQITDPLISRVVQDVLGPYGASCTGIGIGTQAGVFVATYSLGAGELAKLGSITYV